jgi:ribosomal protein L16/L10AE
MPSRHSEVDLKPVDMYIYIHTHTSVCIKKKKDRLKHGRKGAEEEERKEKHA